MKTIFDFNPSKEEIDRIAFPIVTEEDYLKEYNGKDDAVNFDLATLFALRNQRLRMFWYVSKISNSAKRMSFLNCISNF